MVVLTAYVQTNPESSADFKALAQSMLAPSQAEDGCIAYRCYDDPQDSNKFVFVEEWASRDHLETHFQTPHFKDFASKIPDLVTSTEIKIFHVKDTEIL